MNEETAISEMNPVKSSRSVRVVSVIVVAIIAGFGGYVVGDSAGYKLGYLRGTLDGVEIEQFSFYYVKPEEQRSGVYDLEVELGSLYWIYEYQEGVFDCSEMSASLERILENRGWHAIIALGDSPFGSGIHAWLLVETEQGGYMPVEATTMEIVWWDDPYFENYFLYDYEFDTIQEAIAYNEDDFDWWKQD